MAHSKIKKNKILIIDDEGAVARSIADILNMEGYIAKTAGDATIALAMLNAEPFDLILSDVKLPGISGLEFLLHLKELQNTVPVIVMSGHGTIDIAVQAMKQGARDYLEKPIDLNRLLHAVKMVFSMHHSVKVKNAHHRFTEKIIGSSQPMLDILDRIRKVAPSDARVLITGPSGSGKELVARQIHELSLRSQQAFVDINCAAIPSDLIESELFGHEKGAFTGAHAMHRGKFELAAEGTLFLDEIGDMHMHMQSKLLRVLQEGALTRIGSEISIPVRPRIIAATNKNVIHEISQKTFREDLYHRIAVVTIEVPALSQRRDDIPELCNYFLNRYTTAETPLHITPSALQLLVDRDWPGNIRELGNVIERLCVFCKEDITVKDIEAYV
jgi:two-component system nitrogen regulation response regulator NtrX